MNYQDRVDCALNQDPMRCLESPMERKVYNEFKTNGIVPIMQHPVGKYFIDLAFPEVKIGVEYDGLHHMETENFEKDKVRTGELEKMGWSIYQIFHNGTRFEVKATGGTRYFCPSLYVLLEEMSKDFRKIIINKRREEKY